MLRSVPLISRESRCVKRDSGRSPDFRSFGVVYKPSLLYKSPLDLPINGLTVVFSADTNQSYTVAGPWRIFAALPYSPVFPAPESSAYSIVMQVLYHISLFFANLFLKRPETLTRFFHKKFDNIGSMWYYNISIQNSNRTNANI